MIATTTTTAIGSTVGVLNTTDGNVDVLVQKDSDPTQLRFSIPNNISLVAILDGGTFYMPPQSTAEKQPMAIHILKIMKVTERFQRIS